MGSPPVYDRCFVYAPIFASFLDSILEPLQELSSSPWFYLVIFSIAFFDSVVPIVPSETTVILGGIAAGQGELLIALVILAGALGAFAGDNMAYQLGYRAKDWLTARLFSSGKGAERLDWATTQIEKRGGPLLITARFIPGGRTALTSASGITAQPLDWFMKWDAIAAIIWASYAGGLGFVAGDRFKDDHTTAFLVAFGTAIGITALIEVVRWAKEKRHESAA